MISGSLAFRLAYVPAKLAATHATRGLLDQLSTDVAVAADRELKHAVEFAQKAAQIERKIAAEDVSNAVARAATAGVDLPPLPESAEGWAAWRSSLDRAIGAKSEDAARLGLVLGSRAFDLMFAWSRAELIAYLRGARADHPVLVAAARQCVLDVAAAWSELDLAAKACGRPLVEDSHKSVASSMKRAPAADAVKSSGYSSAFSHVVDWLRHFDDLIGGIGQDLDVPVDAPPTRPASAEEEQLVAAIVANPDDDALRHRFAELAEQRGDARAALVREHYAQIRDPRGEAGHRAYDRVRAHPEWSAPLTALGARDVKFTRGFPSEITIELDPLLANANELFSLAPITTLRVRGGLAGRGAELAALPQLAKLTALDLANQGVTDADIAALVRSPRLARLRVLTLHMNVITAVGVEAIAAATHAMPSLTSVDLQLNHADPTDKQRFYSETEQEYYPTPEGQALEAKYGRLRWLHPEG